MRVRIDKMGNFHIQKRNGGALIPQNCPYAEAPCGTWCPRFSIESSYSVGDIALTWLFEHVEDARQFQILTCADKPCRVESADFVWEKVS